MGEPLKVGVVGCGTISKTYFDHCTQLPNVDITAAADLEPERAQEVAGQREGVRALSIDDLYADDGVEAVLNLTVPSAHGSVALAALDAGKHVYGEKPLAATRQEARPILEAARRAGLRVGCAPDTVLGRGTQTARVVLDQGAIGTPTSATAFFVSPGPEGWHPNPEFYFKPGGGPLLDMGPYYLTSLVTLLGPVRRVVAASRRGVAERTVGSGPKAGTTFSVDVETHVTGVLEHASGVLTTVITSFDVHGARLPRIEVHGDQSSVSVPDPNTFGGTVELYRPGEREWETVEPSGGYAEAGRGFGVSDMARAIREGGPHRANGDVAFHVLDIMESLLQAAEDGKAVDIESDCERPESVPLVDTPDQR